MDNLCVPVDNLGGGGPVGVTGILRVPAGIQKSSNLGLYTGSHMQS